MQTWILYAILSMFFAGFTSVIAKVGLSGISGELGLAVRTVFVFGLVMLFGALTIPRTQIGTLTSANVFWLGISGLTTTASWVFYYKAIKLGDVSTVVLIDKGSVVIAILLAALLLKESLTPGKLIGAVMIVAGLFVIARDA